MSHAVVTISNRKPTEWYYLYDQFVQSLKGFQPALMFNYGQWGGLASKPKWLMRAIKEGHLNYNYLIFADCWDLVFARDTEEIMERYHSFDKDIVISAEKNCFPVDTKDEYDKLESPTIYKYLNSGFIVGKTEAILSCLEAMDLENVPDDHYDPINKCNVHPNDQLLWQQIFLKQPVSIALDHYQALSQTLHDANIEDFEFNKHGIKNLITGAYPCAMHFNGGSKDNLSLREPILKHLNLA